MDMMRMRMEGFACPLVDVRVEHRRDFGVLPFPDEQSQARGAYRSVKCGMEMPLTSQQEVPGLRFAEADGRVIRYAPFALRITAQNDQERWSETITRLEFTGGDSFRCVKVYACGEELWDPRKTARLGELSVVVSALGGAFSVELSDELVCHPGYEAVCSINHHRHTVVTPDDLIILDRVFGCWKNRPFSLLERAYGNGQTAEAKLGAMVASRMVAVPLDGPIRGDLPMWRV